MVEHERPVLIRGGRVIDPSQGIDATGDVLLQEGVIAWVASGAGLHKLPAGVHVLEAKGLVVCPGFVDLHTHLREPGFEDKETIATGTRAAALGGFTTICAMPNTDPPIDSAATVDFVAQKAREQGSVHVLPIGCVTRGRRGKELADLAELAEAGVVGYSDDGDPVADPLLMQKALSYATQRGLPVIQHLQEPTLTQGSVLHEGWVASRLGLKGWPPRAEEGMAARDIELARVTTGRLHLAHVSTQGTVALLRHARAAGIPVSAEATPHHLLLSHEWALGKTLGGDLASPDLYQSLGLNAYDTMAKVNPPLRARRDAAALVEALREGTIEAVATDHAPHASVDKECTFDDAASGISGLETALGLLLQLVRAGDIPLPTLIERLTAGPARLLGRHERGLGTLRAGAVADVTIFDPEEEWVVRPDQFASKGKNTPLSGVMLRGRVVATVVGGCLVDSASGRLGMAPGWGPTRSGESGPPS